MHRTFSLGALALVLAATIGCTKDEPIEPQYTGVELSVTEYAPDMRDHYTSYGHLGRGGAALRKPAYQPVLGSRDSLETEYGKLYPELQPKPNPPQGTVAVPASTIASNCNTPSSAKLMSIESDFYAVMANDKGSVDEYIRVRDKLCKGATRLTYEEWEVLVEGTPKDVPLRLKPKVFPQQNTPKIK